MSKLSNKIWNKETSLKLASSTNFIQLLDYNNHENL